MPAGALTNTCSICGREASADSPHTRRIGRHQAEAGDRQALRLEFGFQRGARMRLRRRVARQEHQPGGIQLAQREAGFGRHRAQERIRLLEQQAAAVARQAVGRNRAAVRHARQRADRVLHQRVAGLIVDLRNQAEAAAILFEIGRIQRPVQPALSFHGSVCSGNSGLPMGQAAKNLSEKCGILIPQAACGNDCLWQGLAAARVYGRMARPRWE